MILNYKTIRQEVKVFSSVEKAEEFFNMKLNKNRANIVGEPNEISFNYMNQWGTMFNVTISKK